MSLLNDDFKRKIFEIKNNEDLPDDYFNNVKLLKKHLDDFNLLNKMKDDFFLSIYRKNFNEILEFEIENNFKYSKQDILGIENKIRRLSNIKNEKYVRILDYMVIKISDLDSPLYGTVINFISFVFDDINYTLEMCDKIKDIWEEKYKDNFLTFKEFEKSSQFEKAFNELVSLKTNTFFNFTKTSDVFEFLIFCSEGSDFVLEGYDLDNDNIDEFLFDNDKESYKKYGEKILFDIKNKIVSYN